MAFDQAQTFRLGQASGSDNTLVIICEATTIPEAPWHGMVIYRTDLQILQVYRSSLLGGNDAFEDVLAGQAGILTFVGDTVPVSEHIGDLWYDTGHNRTLYIAKSVGANSVTTGQWELVVAPLTIDDLVRDGLLSGAISVADLTATTITGAVVQTRQGEAEGVKVGKLVDRDGVYVYRDDGELFFKVVPTEGVVYVGSGEVKISSLTVSSGDPNNPATGSLGGQFEIPPSAVTTISEGVTAPKTKPVVTFNYQTTQFTDDNLWNGTRYGLGWDGSFFWTARDENGINTDDVIHIEKWTSAGAFATTYQIDAGNSVRARGCVAYNGWTYCLYSKRPALGPDRYYIGFTNGLEIGKIPIDPVLTDNTVYTGRWPTLGFDNTNNKLIMAWIGDPVENNQIYSLEITPEGTTTSHATGTTIVGSYPLSASSKVLVGYLMGTYDFGGTRTVMTTYGTDDFQVFNAGVVSSSEIWPTAGNNRVGFTYMDDHFVAIDVSGKLRHYTNQWGTNASNQIKYVANTLASATAETTLSGVVQVTMPKRSRMRVSVSPVPAGSDADRAKVYVGRGATYPGRTAMWLQDEGDPGQTNFTFTSLVVTGTNPPATSTFDTSAAPGKLRTASGGFELDGAGNGSPGDGSFYDAIKRTKWVHVQNTAYTPVLTDRFKIIQMNDSATNTLTIPVDVFAVDDWFEVYMRGTGQTRVDGSLVTLNAIGMSGAITTLNISSRHGLIRCWQRASNVWVAYGDVGTVT